MTWKRFLAAAMMFLLCLTMLTIDVDPVDPTVHESVKFKQVLVEFDGGVDFTQFFGDLR